MADEQAIEYYDDFDEEYQGASVLPWWVVKAPPILISGIFHAAILIISAYMITNYFIEKKERKINIINQPKVKPLYNPELQKWTRKSPEILGKIKDKKPVIMIEEEVELTMDIPRGTSFDNLANKEMNAMSVLDVFGPGPGGSGAYGQRSGRGSNCNDIGSRPTEDSVLAALRWLHFHQDKPEGKWDADDYQKNCIGPGAPCEHGNPVSPSGHFDVGVSSLALLAFLGNGKTHRAGNFKKTVRRSLKYLIRSQDRTTGRFGDTSCESWIYNHALATMAICEAFAVTRDNILKVPAQKAVDYMIQAQNPGYGWKYKPRDGKNDTSVTGWMVLGLKAAKMAKLVVPRSSFDGAIAWFDRVTRVSDGKVGYMRPGDGGSKLADRDPDLFRSQPTMTAVSVLCRIFCGQKRSNTKIRQGVKILMGHIPVYNRPKNDKVNYYYWYYATYAMFQVGGKNWDKWNKAIVPVLCNNQRSGRICQDGSWDPIGEWSVVGGRVYATAINALTLEIYYRYERVMENRKRRNG